MDSICDRLDLGFNNETVDSCDYLDYSDLTKNKSDKNHLTVLQLNICGVLNKQDELKDLLNDIKRDSRVDVVMMVETWLNNNNANRLKIPGYHFFGSHRKHKRGGVGILISQELECRTRKDLSLNIPNFESLTLEIKTNIENFYACTIYRPPNGSGKEFNKHYKRLLGKFKEAQIEKLIIGLDHNLDFTNHTKHPPTKEFIDTNLDRNLIPTITKPTRITRNSATLIDNIIVGKQFHNFEANIGISDISDYLPLILKSYQPKLYKKQPLLITTRAINEAKCNNINSRLDEINWTLNLDGKSVNDAYTYLQAIIMEILDQESPIQTIRIKSNKILKEPWMTPGLLRSVKKQKTYYRKSIAKQSTGLDQSRYKEYRNKLTQILRRVKEDYYKSKCTEFKRNTTKLWKMINRITGKMNDKSNAIKYLKVENIEIYDTKIISEEFAKHFSSVGSMYANKITQSHNTFNQYLRNIPNNPISMFMAPTSRTEIEKLIDKLPNKTSKGHDDISNILLKRIKSTISHPLEIIFNKSIQDGVFPEDMKQADVIPLHKSKEKFIVNNYRPISLLLTMSKILQKIVYGRIYSFLCNSDQLFQSQYGFRTGHSCENAICELVGTVAKNRAEKKHTIGVFIDLSKAFDTLNHQMLLSKMDKYGIRRHSLEWFRSYLSNRTMRVKCTSNTSGQLEYSTYHKLEYGTPQGSCLGPLLFLIYINDLHYTIQYSSVILFADDTTILHGHKNLNYLKWSLEEDLK